MSAGPEVRTLRPEDLKAAVRMRTELWPEEAEDHEVELLRFLRGEPLLGSAYLAAFPRTVLVAELDGAPRGLAEVGVRSFADGCYDGLPVAYLEGWFVDRSVRGRGVGRALLEAAFDWARSKGCTEMASDVEPDNDPSLRAHAKLGFEEVGRAVLFRRRLVNDSR